MRKENLLDVVKAIQARIVDHGDSLGRRELQTRYALIDPLLRVLGWDTGDPRLVIPEYPLSEGRSERPDYALFLPGNPNSVMMIEAKPLGNLGDAAMQCSNYCNNQGVPYFSVTDGNIWETYETFAPKRLEEKRIAHFNMQEMLPEQAAIKSLALWRADSDFTDRQEYEPMIFDAPTTNGWQPLIRIVGNESGKFPIELLLPDNSQIRLSRPSYRAVIIEVVKWLRSRRLLNTDYCPIEGQQRKKYIVSITPYHPDKREFKKHEQIGNLFLETQVSRGATLHLKNACTVIETVGLDPSQFKVRLSS